MISGLVSSVPCPKCRFSLKLSQWQRPQLEFMLDIGFNYVLLRTRISVNINNLAEFGGSPAGLIGVVMSGRN